MIPIKLSFQAFESYVQMQEIDFLLLAKNGLFLINGETGSGKTAILDAITYALYGETSGGERGDVRCLSPDAEFLPTIVQFDFKIRNNLYRFTRTLRRKSTNSATTLVTEQLASFWNYSNAEFQPFEPSQTRSFVSAKATQLIGLTLEQFRQVILLPQGRFERFLTSESSEKERILSALFRVDLYSKISENIHRKAKNAVADLERGRTENAVLITGNGFENESQLREHLKMLKENNILSQEQLRQLRRDLHTSQKQYIDGLELLKYAQEQAKLTENFNKLSAQQGQWDKILPRVNRAKELSTALPIIDRFNTIFTDQQSRLTEYDHAKKYYDEVHALWERANDDFQALSSEQPSSAKRQEQLDLLKSVQSELEELQTLEALNSAIKIELDTAEQEKNLWQDKQHHLQDNINDKNIKITRYRLALEESSVIERRLENLKNASKLQSEQNELLIEEERLNARIQTTDAKLTSAEHKLSQLSAMHEQFVREHSEQILNSLAQDLVDGQPCPLCGSNYHPSPKSALPIQDVTKYQSFDFENISFKTISEDLADAQRTFSHVVAEKSSLETAISLRRQQISQIEQTLRAADFSPESLVTAENDVKSLRHIRRKLDSDMLDLQHLEEEMGQVLINLEKINQQYLAVKEKMVSSDAQILARKDNNVFRKIMCHFDESEIDNSNKINEHFLKIQSEEDDFQEHYNHSLNEEKKFSSLNSAAQVGLEKAETELSRTRELLAVVQNEIDELLLKYEFSSQEQLLASLLPREEIEKIEAKYVSYKQQIAYIEEQLSAISQRTNNKELPGEPQLRHLAERQKLLEAELQQATEVLAVAQNEENRLTKVLTTYKSKNHDIDLAMDSAQRQLAFSSLLQGEKEVSFTRFVLGVLLSLVTSEANRLLRDVHGGQFQIYRRRDIGDRRMKSGLDLEVQSAMSSSRMNVQNLSGGEKFLISLALSLALAEVLQRQAGGINIETMFIDEGFGTLDKKSLKEALVLLQNLSRGNNNSHTNSNVEIERVVGIISHVDDLKQAISSRIEVRKDASGSNLVVSAFQS